MSKEREIFCMKKALALAKKGLGLTGVNPTVGAVLVKDGKIIGKGCHIKANLDHAEIVALEGLSYKKTKGAILYVTMEPCCHKDKVTPPCSEKIIGAGIRKVVIGLEDPNKRVKGKGVKVLRAAGIEVVEGLLGEESAALNEFYLKSITTSLPFVAVKQAVSLDGRIAAADGSSRWISNLRSRKIVHRLRSVYDAVMTSGVTVKNDDPGLDVRIVKGRNPKRIVVDWSLDTDISAKVYRNGDAIVIASLTAGVEKERLFAEKGIEIRRYDKGKGLRPVLRDLYADGIGSIMVEAGGRFAAGLLREGVVDKFIYFVAPIFLGAEGVGAMGKLGIRTIKNAIRAKFTVLGSVDDNLLLEVKV